MTQDLTPDSTRRIVIQRGLFYGAIIAGLELLGAVIAWLTYSANTALVSALGNSGVNRYSAVALVIGVALLGFATYAVPFILGISVYKRLRRIGAAALAGLIAGSVGGVVSALATLAFAMFTSLAPAASPYGSPLTATLPLLVGVFSVVSTLAWSCASGAGLGALGALVRQAIYR